MKRVIAILLTLLLLLSMIGCKEAKNYTVKEVDGYRTIVLDAAEISRIDRELNEQGYSFTELQGFEDSDFSYSNNTRWKDFGTAGWRDNPNLEQQVIGSAQMIAKCHLVKREIYRLDYCDTYVDKEKKNSRKEQYFFELYTLEIDKLFHSDGDEQCGDVITLFYHLQCVYVGGYEASVGERGSLILNAPLRVEPASEIPFYIFAYRTSDNSEGWWRENTYDFQSVKAASEFMWYDSYSTIYEIAPNEYELHSKFVSLTEGAEVIPEEERTTWLDMRLKTDDFDQRMKTMLQKYGK